MPIRRSVEALLRLVAGPPTPTVPVSPVPQPEVVAPDTGNIPGYLYLRNMLRRYIFGNGIEVGALNAPLSLTGLAVTGITYVDRIGPEEQRRHYGGMEDIRFARVDIIDDGETLGSFAPESVDFIIGNHFIEHTRNPIGTLRCWASKLRPGGVLFLAVPDKRFTFDVDRQLTPLEHLIADDRDPPEVRQERDMIHYAEWATHIDKLAPEQLPPRIAYLIEIGYAIHFHTFTMASFLLMVDHLRTELPLAIKACGDTLPDTNEFVVVLTKTN